MMKKRMALLGAMILSLGLLCGCGKSETIVEETNTVETEVTEATEVDEAESDDEESENAAAEETPAEENALDDVTVRVASLKGPTSIGLVKLWDDASNGNTSVSYEFTMSTQADEILPLLLKGDMDIALVPANAAANLYQKSEGKICVVDINTLGVLYLVSGDASIDSIEALKGKTVYLTGKGTTPDYAIQYLLTANGLSLSDVTLEYKSEATEVAAVLSENPDGIGLLPQPFVTAACAQNDQLSVVVDLNAEWEKAQDGKGIITGVTVARKAFVEEHANLVAAFIEDHKNSADFVNSEVEAAAELVAQSGIIEKAPVAMKAIPKCNITCIAGSEMKDMLADYLEILNEQNPEFIGGKLPEDDFYYVGE